MYKRKWHVEDWVDAGTRIGKSRTGSFTVDASIKLIGKNSL